MAGIFISYRRDDSAGWTGRLSTDLQERFGQEAVFQDIGAIEAGEDFIAAIGRSLESCSAVLVVIGPEWSLIKDKTGARRLDNPEDTVRLEIAKALTRPDRLVIPVLVGGAQMPMADELPPELKALAHRNAFELSDKRWNYDLEQLVASLVKKTGLTQKAHLGSPGLKPARWLTALSSVVVAVVALLAGYWYFVTQESSKSPLEAFEITQPGNGEELPLGENQRWMLEGTLRLAAEPGTTTNNPRMNVKVFKLPERQAVPQGGEMFLSTERGLWRFESATFAGEGTYEVVATVVFDGKSDFQTLTVKCAPKATAYRQAISRDRDSRGVHAVTPVQLNPVELSALKQRVYRMQNEFFRLLPHDLDGAATNAIQTLDLLDPVLPSYPNDWYLQNLRAYALKNYAMVMRDRDKPEEFNRALGEAGKMFEVIRQQNPDDPSAWNGLGSVALLRNDPVSALYYIDRALEIRPDYNAAQHDRVIAVQMLEQQKGSGR